MGQPDCFECKYGGLEHPCRDASGRFCVETAAAALMTRLPLLSADLDDAKVVAALEAVDWIVDCEYELLEDHPDVIPSYALAVMNRVRTPQDAAYVAAGLIETALVKHGSDLIASFETMAAASAKVRYILSGVWSQSGSIDTAVWHRLAEAVAPGPYMDHDPRTPVGQGSGSTGGDRLHSDGRGQVVTGADALAILADVIVAPTS